MTRREKLLNINEQIAEIIQKAKSLEVEYKSMISVVYPDYRQSALNLLHYLALRSFDIDELQSRLKNMGLPDLSNIEGHVMRSLLMIRTIINALDGQALVEKRKGIT